MNKKLHLLPLFPMLVVALTGCSGDSGDPTPQKLFSYEEASFVDEYGTHTNEEAHDYQNLKVNKLDKELREDFAFGVDASMTDAVELNGGIYYNQDGKEQDLFQILKRSGVNFVRLRLWNNPTDKYGDKYGGGDNSLATDIALAKRIKKANMNVLIDFHYSDFWADPDRQRSPREWESLLPRELPDAIKEYTVSSLNAFKDAGVTVDAVQIGNEINNGLAGFDINWSSQEASFDQMASMLKAGVEGAKSVFPDVRTIVHLANGGNTAEFENFFTGMSSRGVNYDIVGASYYPHLSGSLDELQTNLNNVSNKVNKPVMVVETSWGFTDDYVVKTELNTYKTYHAGQHMSATDTLVTGNTYSSDDEEIGGYLTSEQAQATMIRDITNVLANVPSNQGLGIFYWEPGWLPVFGADWATDHGQSYLYYGNDSRYKKYDEHGLATWSNQGLFSYTGKALSSLKTYSYLKDGFNEVEEVSLQLRHEVIDNYTINVADHETLPAKAKVETNLDAIRERKAVWEDSALEAVKSKGVHNGLKGVVEGKYNIVCNANCIENYVKDPGFEKQGESDAVIEPWILKNVNPAEKVAKLDRKKDIRSGKTDLNWYHGSKDFSFTVYQEITLPAGKYNLKTYVMSVAMSKIAHTKFELFVEVEGEEPIVKSYCDSDHLKGYGSYAECTIDGFEVASESKVKIGLNVAAKAGAWGHNDDWELVSID